MVERVVFFVSDQTGVTAETLGHSLITQFAGQNFRQMTLPFIDTEDKAREAVKKINAASAEDELRPIVFSTLVQPECRQILKESQGLHLDIFDVFLDPLEVELELELVRVDEPGAVDRGLRGRRGRHPGGGASCAAGARSLNRVNSLWK